MPLRSIAFMLYFVGSTTGALFVPMLGVVCYIVLYSVFPGTTWWGEPLAFLGLRYSFICGLCLAIGTLVSLNRQPLGKHLTHPIEWCLVAMLVIMVLSTVTGTPWDRYTTQYLDKMVKVVVFSLIMTHVATTRHRMWVIVLAFMLTSLYLGHEAENAPPGSFVRNRLNNIGGPDFYESSSLAIHLVSMLPFVGILLLDRLWRVRILAFLAAGYSVNGALMCQTRSAFVGAVCAGFIGLLYAPRHHRKWIVTLLILGALGGYVLSDKSFRDRMSTITSSDDERDNSSQQRLDTWAASWRLIKRRPAGVGVGHFSSQVGLILKEPDICGRDAHSTYVRCVAELGVPGFLLFMTMLLLSWRTLSSASRYARHNLSDPSFFDLLIFANRMSLVVFCVSGVFVTRLYTEAFWWLIAMPVCISRAVEYEARTEEAATEEIIQQLKQNENVVVIDNRHSPATF